MSTILEDKNFREKRGYICPERGFWTILSVKKLTIFVGSPRDNLHLNKYALTIQSRLEVSIPCAQIPTFLPCIGGWYKPMTKVELSYLFDFFFNFGHPTPLPFLT
jgi:hypothetical protein